MQLVVLADEVIKQEFEKKILNTGTKVIYIESLSEISSYKEADVFFLLTEVDKPQLGDFGKPVFINSTISTLSEMGLPVNYSRVNGWPGFLSRDIWEIAPGNVDVNDIFEKLGWKYITVADEPGLVSARIISMIINEAYFALGEGVSSKEEIDIAMKLGTNYPYGPFEWSEKIGLHNIYALLEKLSKTDSRYTIAPAMKSEIQG